MNIPGVLLLCIVAIPVAYAQSIDSAVIVEYLESLGTHILQGLKQYGVSNLPDVSVAFPNYTDPAKGILHFESGFVLDITGILMTTRTINHGFTKDNASIHSEMSFTNLEVVREFHFDADDPNSIQDETEGTVTIKPKRFFFYYSIVYNMRTHEKFSSISGWGFERGDLSELLRFDPTNTFLLRVRKNFQRESKGINVLNGDELFKLWQPIFYGFLRDAVEKVDFPEVQFPTSPGKHS